MNKSLGIYNLIDKTEINKSIKNIINSNIDFNTYTTPKGLKPLRIEISHFINRIWKYEIKDKNMLITSGTQQSINLIAYAMLKEKDTILIEQPTYFGAIDIFRKRNINLIGIDLLEDGLDLKKLEKRIIQYAPKLIYVIPTFNNPTGYAWTNIKRKEFLNIINKYNLLVIEDDPYSLINYTNNKYESLYKLNKGKNIIYLGTFSKLISPSINIGYIISKEKTINKIYEFKKNFDLCTNTFLQYIILDYLQNNNLEKRIKNKIKIYKKYKKKSITEIKKKYKNQIEQIKEPKGGMFYLVKFKTKRNEKIFENGNKYYIDNRHNHSTRINICSEFKDKI